VTAASDGLEVGKAGLPVIPFTMPWTYVMRAGTPVGSLRMAMGRWMVLGAVIWLHLRWNGCVGGPRWSRVAVHLLRVRRKRERAEVSDERLEVSSERLAFRRETLAFHGKPLPFE
jgi:hypothetical protein